MSSPISINFIMPWFKSFMSQSTSISNTAPKFACFLTVRTGSTRLPQKTLLPIQGKRLIEHVIERMKLLREVDQIILCTSTEPSDDILETIARENNIAVFRGSLRDKVARWLGAVDKFSLDYFVTVDAADDIFCDPELIDLAVRQMKAEPCDYLKIPDDLVCGGSAPVISGAALRRVCEIKDTDKVENYAPYFLDTGLFKVREIMVKDETFHNKNVRLTLDYQEDFDFFSRIFAELGMSTNTTPLRKILQLLNEKPELNKINFHRHQDYLTNQKRITNLILKKDSNSKG